MHQEPSVLLPPRLRGLAEVSCLLLQDAQERLGALQDLQERKQEQLETTFTETENVVCTLEVIKNRRGGGVVFLIRAVGEGVFAVIKCEHKREFRVSRWDLSDISATASSFCGAQTRNYVSNQHLRLGCHRALIKYYIPWCTRPPSRRWCGRRWRGRRAFASGSR